MVIRLSFTPISRARRLPLYRTFGVTFRAVHGCPQTSGIVGIERDLTAGADERPRGVDLILSKPVSLAELRTAIAAVA
jgi:hypothetical protein